MIESGTIPRKKRNARADVHDAQALDMRLGGASYRQISKALGVPLATAHRHVQQMLREYATEPATQVRDMEVARLDRLLSAHWGKATNGDINATRMVLTIMDRRAKLLGLDAPQRIFSREDSFGQQGRLHQRAKFVEKLPFVPEPLGPDTVGV